MQRRTMESASDSRLILFEGPVGAGKSTTCELLGERLRARGKTARDWFGFDVDHPITTRCERLARRYLGGEEDVGPPTLDPRDETLFTAPRWARFAEELAAGEGMALVEGKYFQQCLEYLFLAGAGREAIRHQQAAIAEAMAPARPRLIYFRVSDPVAHRASVVAERPEGWPAALGGFFALHPWARDRGLEGADAFHAFYEVWAPIEAELFEFHPGPKLALEDAHRDRAAAWVAIERFLGES